MSACIWWFGAPVSVGASVRDVLVDKCVFLKLIPGLCSELCYKLRPEDVIKAGGANLF